MALRPTRWLQYLSQVAARPKRALAAKKRPLALNPWSVVKVLHNPWRRLDAAVSKYREDVHHRVLDSAVGALRGKNVFFPYGFYPDGFGDPSVLLMFFDQLQAADCDKWAAMPAPVQPTLQERIEDPANEHVWLQDGVFETPFELKDELLPRESHTARFQLVLPKLWDSVERRTPRDAPVDGVPSAEDESAHALAARRPIVVLLAGTGEHGYTRRRLFISYALAKRGVASLILESPFYGTRRPPKQKASKLRRVCDLPVLGRVTIQEAQGLLEWLRHSGDFGPMAIAGMSMGGLHAAITAAFTPYPVGVASYLGPTSAAPVFTKGVLAKACEWKSLIAGSTDPHLEACLREFEDRMEALRPGSIHKYAREDPAAYVDVPQAERFEFAKRQVDRYLQITNLTNFPVPAKPAAASFVVAKYDAYIPAETMKTQWQAVEETWKGCKLRWIPGGHVSAILFPPDCFTTQIVDVLHNIPDQVRTS